MHFTGTIRRPPCQADSLLPEAACWRSPAWFAGTCRRRRPSAASSGWRTRRTKPTGSCPPWGKPGTTASPSARRPGTASPWPSWTRAASRRTSSPSAGGWTGRPSATASFTSPASPGREKGRWAWPSSGWCACRASWPAPRPRHLGRPRASGRE